MSDINIGVCPVCRQKFDLSDGVPCDCIVVLEDEAAEEDRRIARMDARYDEMREGEEE
jgi:hypothetical protein